MSNLVKSKFVENYHGILCHDGWVRVAKFKITAKILNIQSNRKIQVKGNGRKKSYICNVHKNLRSDIKFLEKGDTVGIKFNMGKPYIVAYRKQFYDQKPVEETGDDAISENSNWISFFKKEVKE